MWFSLLANTNLSNNCSRKIPQRYAHRCNSGCIPMMKLAIQNNPFITEEDRPSEAGSINFS